MWLLLKVKTDFMPSKLAINPFKLKTGHLKRIILDSKRINRTLWDFCQVKIRKKCLLRLLVYVFISKKYSSVLIKKISVSLLFIFKFLK